MMPSHSAEELNTDSLQSESKADFSAFLDPQMPDEKRSEKLIRVCEYTMRIMVGMAIITSLIHYHLQRQGSPI